ncbi:MAG TPA: hypothetical protein VFY40_13030 [Blastocatellia bacterium]|nr:hypothetical protein [Blastocatellia bacterium]
MITGKVPSHPQTGLRSFVGAQLSIKQTGQPVHDIKRQLFIVVAFSIHAEFQFIGARYLRRHHRGFPKDDYFPFAEAKRNRL